MDKKKNIIKILERYKEKISISKLEDEKYKWELVEKYKHRPDVTSNDFFQEIKSIDFKNLVYHNSKAVIQHLAKENPEEIRILFTELFDESINLETRVNKFNKDTLTLYRDLGETLSHHQDERTIATYLTFYDSDTYTFYKNSFYGKYCEYLGIKKAKKNKKYIHYLELINDLIENYIINDDELITLVKNLIPEYYDGKNHNLLAQDILYQMFDQKSDDINDFYEIKGKFDEDVFKTYELYLQKIINELNLKNNDQRIVYGVLEDRLNFTIGQRYCFNLYLSNKNGKYGIISQDKLLEGSEPFGGASQPKHFYNYYFDFLPSETEWLSIINAMKDELLRTTKSGYIKHNNSDFENYIFEKKIITKGKDMSSLNTILYGPPGTGKTYSTINKAIEIIENRKLTENELQERDSLKEKFEEYKSSGQIEFVTFHQSYGYEEFVEGIKADTNQADEVIYTKENGIFKRLALEAIISSIQITKESTKSLDFDEIYNGLLEKVSNGEIDSLPSKTTSDILVSDITKNNNINFKHQGGNKKYLASKERLKKLFAYFNSQEKFDSISNINDEFREVIGGCNSSVYWAVLNYIHINNIEEEYQAIDIENMTELEQKEIINNYLKTPQSERKQKNNTKNYILIIDEINRGNISKIFGELITLLEDSKRVGAKEELKVRLPYTHDEFGVPSNLYILGTMNTADRSIALMDTALRRRFEFTEMMPDLTTLEEINDVVGINIESLLETINKRIEYLYDRDHTIGHAYFMDLKEDSKSNITTLSSIFKNKIIPLLQEYFYDDWEKIRLVLGDNQKDDKNTQFITIKQGYKLKDLFGDKGLDSLEIDDESSVYAINKIAFDKPESYIRVYEK